MAHSVNDFFAAVDPIANREFWGVKDEMPPSQYDQIFKVGSDDEPVFSWVEYGTPPSLSEKTENAAVQQKTITQGPIKSVRAITHAAALTLSFEAAKDVKNRYAKLAQAAAGLGEAVRITPELICALVLDRAFNSSYPVIADGLELCSTVHELPDGVTTFATEASTPTALDESTAEDIRTSLRTQPGPSGNIQPRKVTGWIVPAALDTVASKLSRTTKTVGSANNDESLVSGTKVINFDYLGSSTRFFAKTDSPRPMLWDWIDRPDFLTDQVILLLQKVYVAFFRARIAIRDPRCLFGVAAS